MGELIALRVSAAILAAILGGWFLHRFFRKASPETALVRTGAGGSKVVIDGGCLVLPFLHHVRTVSMRATSITVALTGPRSVITADRLRADVEMQFLGRITPTREGVAAACQAMGTSVGRPEEVADFVKGHFVDAIQAVAAGRTLNAIHENRQDFAAAVRRIADEVAGRLGLELEAASLTNVDQAAFAGFDENNAFNSAGMRRLAEIVSEDYPGERLVACYNPLLAEERSRKREDLLAATQAGLERVAREAARRTRKRFGAAELYGQTFR